MIGVFSLPPPPETWIYSTQIPQPPKAGSRSRSGGDALFGDTFLKSFKPAHLGARNCILLRKLTNM